MKKIIAILITLLLSLTIISCGKKAAADTDADTRETVKIAYLPITHALPVLVEAELEKENPNINVKLIKYSSWAELMDALNTGHVDGASVLIELAMKAKEQGIDLKAVALGHKDGNVVITKKEIADASELKGKTFAIPHRQSSHNILLRQLLENSGLAESDVTVIELAPPEMPAALAQGTIQGYCVAEPFGAKSVALDTGKVLFESGDLWEDSLCCSLVLTNEFITKKSDAAKELVSKYGAAGKYITEHKEEANAIAKQYLSIEDNVLDISMEWISYDDLTITEETYTELINKIKAFGLSENPPEYSDFVDSSLLN